MKHTTLSRFASLAASAALALSLAACGSTSRSTYSAAVSNDTAAFSSQDAGDYEYYSAESAAAGCFIAKDNAPFIRLKPPALST